MDHWAAPYQYQNSNQRLSWLSFCSCVMKNSFCLLWSLVSFLPCRHGFATVNIASWCHLIFSLQLGDQLELPFGHYGAFWYPFSASVAFMFFLLKFSAFPWSMETSFMVFDFHMGYSLSYFVLLFLKLLFYVVEDLLEEWLFWLKQLRFQLVLSFGECLLRWCVCLEQLRFLPISSPTF